jgi:hypothetical protein
MFILHGESRAENTGRYERDVSVHGVRLLLRCVSATCGTSILPPVRALPACAAASPLPRDRMVAGSLCGAFASPARSLRSLRCPWANWPVPVRIRSRHAGWLQDRQHQTLQRHNLEQPRRMSALVCHNRKVRHKIKDSSWCIVSLTKILCTSWNL